MDNDEDIIPPFQSAATPLGKEIRAEEVRKSFAATNNEQIALQNMTRKANVNSNPIGSLKYLW